MPQALPALTWTRFLDTGRFDPAMFALIVLLGTAYGAGVLRLRHRGERWPLARIAVFAVLGLGMIWLATMSALAVYGRVLFWPAAVQNVALDLFAPFGLALGDPVGLAQRALPAPAAAALDRALHSIPVRVLTFPLVSSAAVLATELGVYFTPYFEHALRNQALHELMYLQLLLAGSLFVLPVLTGAEVLPSWCTYPVRAFLVFFDGLLDALPGVVVMLSSARIAGAWYAAQPRDWGPTPQWDQRIGGGAMITLTELVGLPFLLAVFVQWMRDERGRTAALDARLDAELLPAARQEPAETAELVRPWWETDTGEVGARMRRVSATPAPAPRSDADHGRTA